MLPCLLAGFDYYRKIGIWKYVHAWQHRFSSLFLSPFGNTDTLYGILVPLVICTCKNNPSLSCTTAALCVALFNSLFAIPTYAVVCALEEVVDVQQEGPAVGGAALLGEEGHAAGQLGLGVVTQQGHEGNAESDDEGQGYCQPDVSVLSRES